MTLPTLLRHCGFWLLLLQIPLAQASGPLTLPDSELHAYSLTPYVDILRIADPTDSLEWLQQGVTPEPVAHSGEVINLGYNDNTWWLRFTLDNPAPSPRSVLLNVDFPHHDYLTLYQLDGQRLVSRQQSGDRLAFDTRDVGYRMFVFALELPAASSQNFYLRVQSHDSLQLPITLWDPAAFMEQVIGEQYLLGLYYGVLLVMLFYNLILYYRIKDHIYLLYTAYITSLLLVQLCMDGLAFQYLWPELPELGNRLTLAFIFLSSAASFAFTRRFIMTAKYLPGYDRVLKLWLLVMLLSLLPTLAGVTLMSSLAGLLAGVGALVLLLAGLLAWRAGVLSSHYYLVAWSFFLCGALLVSFKAMGILPANLLTTYGMHFGSAIEVVLFSLGLAERINAMRREKNQAQHALMASKQEALELQQSLTQAYQRFVPHEFLDLLNKQSILDVGLGDQVQREMTILFSDIRSFTSLSEQMTPAENFRYINDYLAAVGPLVRHHGGYIDKFIGDAVMALFSRSADESVAAAVAMFAKLREECVRGRFQHGMEIGVGINTGSMMLGTLGEHNRMEGTVISDAVNLASRLEGLTKFYGTPMLISGFTLDALHHPERLQTRFIDRVRVKGKAQAVEIHEVCNAEDTEVCERKMAIADRYLSAWLHYRKGEYAQAETAFSALLDEAHPDGAVKVFIERCQQAQRFGAGWQRPEGDIVMSG